MSAVQSVRSNLLTSTAYTAPVADQLEVRAFFELLNGHATALAKLLPPDIHPGFLQLARISPLDGSTVPSRYRIGDVDGMVRDAVAMAEAGFNVYVESGQSAEMCMASNVARMRTRCLCSHW